MAAFEEEFEEIPDEEKLAIATHYLLSSPPGEISEVLADVKVVCPSELLTSSMLKGVFRTYNTTNQEVIKTADGDPVLVSKYGEIDASHYVVPSTQTVYKINHVKHTAKVDDSVSYSPGPLEDDRAAVEKQVQAYVKRQYGKNTTVSATFAKDDEIVVQITGQKLNLGNFWSGRWKSSWVVKPGDKVISGQMRVLVHYFEDGNVQMHTEKDVDATPLKFSGSSALATKVAEFIEDQEFKVQDALEAMYKNMAQETFKDMRRILPITKQKMDWSGAQTSLAKSFGTDKKT